MILVFYKIFVPFFFSFAPFSVHRLCAFGGGEQAVYDNNLDYLDFLLDQAAEEASMKTMVNGGVDSPVRPKCCCLALLVYTGLM